VAGRIFCRRGGWEPVRERGVIIVGRPSEFSWQGWESLLKWCMMKTSAFFLFGVSCLVGLSGVARGGAVSLSGPLTDDASSLIDAANTYTHKVSGGAGSTVNGVVFDALTSGATPANFSWVSATKAEIGSNLGEWVPASGGVTGSGLVNLLSSFTYSPLGAQAGSAQTFTLAGLTIGTVYDARLYIRVWDLEASGRPIDFTMTNGAEVDTFSGPEDRPGTVLGTGNQQQAYFINYRYTAQTDSLVLTTAVPAGAEVDSGSFHMYGLTNQVVPEPTTALCLALAGLAGVARRRR